MASNWDLFSASLGALSLPHCWLFQSSRLQQTKKCNAAGVLCASPEIRQIKAPCIGSMSMTYISARSITSKIT